MRVSRGRGWGERNSPQKEPRGVLTQSGRALGRGQGTQPGPVLAEGESPAPGLGRGAVSFLRPSVLEKKGDSLVQPWPPPDRNNLKEAALVAGANGGFGVSPENTGLGPVFPEPTCPGRFSSCVQTASPLCSVTDTGVLRGHREAAGRALPGAQRPGSHSRQLQVPYLLR